MPYMFQKGRDWQLLEWWLSHDSATRVDRKLRMLQLLGNSDPKQATGTLNLVAGNGKDPTPDGDEKVLAPDLTHLMNDWLGLDDKGDRLDNHTGTGPKWDPAAPVPPAHLGWWKNWHGNARGIFATTLVKAILVSLGLRSNQSLPQDEEAREKLEKKCTRDWPIEFQWICPVGWFQAGIAWRQTGYPLTEGDWLPGLVTVTWMTPGNTVPQGKPNATVGLFMNLHHAARDPSAGWWGKLGKESSALRTTGLRGSWIVGQKKTKSIGPQVNKGQSGQWVLTLPSTESTGDVVTIRPAWWDGGVNPGPPDDTDWTY